MSFIDLDSELCLGFRTLEIKIFKSASKLESSVVLVYFTVKASLSDIQVTDSLVVFRHPNGSTLYVACMPAFHDTMEGKAQLGQEVLAFQQCNTLVSFN